MKMPKMNTKMEEPLIPRVEKNPFVISYAIHRCLGAVMLAAIPYYYAHTQSVVFENTPSSGLVGCSA